MKGGADCSSCRSQRVTGEDRKSYIVPNNGALGAIVNPEGSAGSHANRNALIHSAANTVSNDINRRLLGCFHSECAS